MMVYNYCKKNVNDLPSDAFFLNKLIPQPQDQNYCDDFAIEIGSNRQAFAMYVFFVFIQQLK